MVCEAYEAPSEKSNYKRNEDMTFGPSSLSSAKVQNETKSTNQDTPKSIKQEELAPV
jgi:hypothetical protein